MARVIRMLSAIAVVIGVGMLMYGWRGGSAFYYYDGNAGYLIPHMIGRDFMTVGAMLVTAGALGYLRRG